MSPRFLAGSVVRTSLSLAMRVAVCALVCAFGLAQPLTALAETLSVASGAPGGTYQVMVTDINQVCGASNNTALVIRATSGSLESLTRLIDNEVPLAIVQADMVQVRGEREPLDQIGLLMTLHAEQFHVIALREPTGLAALRARLGGGTADNLRGLAGQALGSWGGSQVTAARVLARAGIDAEVRDLGTAEQAMRALDKGEVQAVLAVGGAPLPWVSALPRGRYRLLAVSALPARAADKSYHFARLRYDNLGVNAVDTLAVDALLLGRKYRKPEAREALLRLRNCLVRELDTLADRQHPVWRTVDPVRDPGLDGLAPLNEPAGTNAAAANRRRGPP